jgi:NAD-dependent DNA ligase
MAEEKRLVNQQMDTNTAAALAETIPGLGIIRARALRKAGWNSIASLKRATLADLASIPGISEMKAQQILDFVRASRPAEDAALDADREEAAPAAESRVSIQQEPSAPVPVETPLQSLAWKVVSSVTLLLQSEQSDSLSPRLARQLHKMLAYAERLAKAGTAKADMVDRAETQLLKITNVLSKTAGQGLPGPNRQDKLADELRSRRRKLKAMLVAG